MFHVPVPDLRKEFQVPPFSLKTTVGQQVEMRCIAPRGVPPPRISWLKDGQPINDKADTNFIQSGDGHLIVVSARSRDTGNYTCVAENVADRRTSVATLTVDGRTLIFLPCVNWNFACAWAWSSLHVHLVQFLFRFAPRGATRSSHVFSSNNPLGEQFMLSNFAHKKSHNIITLPG